MLVEVRPLPNIKWHGKKNQESFSQPKVIEVLYDDATGRYATGLTEAEAKEYGAKLGGVDLSDTFSYDIPHSFWSTKASWFTLPNHTVIFDDTKAADFVKIKNMKASSRVANSMADVEAGKFPEATHVIFDEQEEIELKASKIQLKNRAIGMLGKLSLNQKIEVVQILSNKSVKEQSADFVDVEIDDIITNKTDDFVKLLQLGSEEVHVRSTVYEMLGKNILTKEGGSIFYMGELIGLDFEAAVSFFKDPNNQKMKVVMMDKLETAK